MKKILLELTIFIYFLLSYYVILSLYGFDMCIYVCLFFRTMVLIFFKYIIFTKLCPEKEANK